MLLALAPAVFSAPFLHLHGHENTDHSLEANSRQTLVSHPHLSEGGYPHGPGAAMTSCEDEDAVSLDWFQGGPQPVPNLEFVLVETTVTPAPEPDVFWIMVPTHRSHDPPLIVSIGPRPPPAARMSPLGA